MNCSGVFVYVGRRVGVTNDGVKYLALDVLSRETKAKFSFVVTDDKLIDFISTKELHDFQDIKCHFNVHRSFNRERRTSFWVIDLIGVE